MNFKRIGTIATWLCVLLIVVLSVVPGDERPHTGFQGHWEHFAAYARTGLVAALTYDSAVRTVAGLGLLSAALELIQNFVPGRTPAVMDAVFSTAGGSAGAVLAVIAGMLLVHSAHREP